MCVSRAAERVREEVCERRSERLPPPEDRLPESRRLLMLMPRDPQRAGSTRGGGLHRALNLGGIHLAECIHRLKGLSLYRLNLVAAE